MRLRGQDRRAAHGALDHRIAQGEADHVARLLRHLVIGQVTGGDHVAQHLAEDAARAGRAGFLEQQIDRDAPAVLAAAMLARDLVDAPLQRFSEAEIIAAEREDRFCHHRAEEPVRERHRHADHAPAARVAHDLPGLDQPEARRHLVATGFQVGGDAGAREPLERFLEAAIGVARGFAVGRHKQVMRAQMQPAADRSAGIQRRHQLADAIDQDVLVMDRGQPLDAWRDLDLHIVMGIAQDAPIGARRQRKNGMLHRYQVILGDGIENIAEEEIPLAVAIGQKRARIGDGTAHGDRLEVSWFY